MRSSQLIHILIWIGEANWILKECEVVCLIKNVTNVEKVHYYLHIWIKSAKYWQYLPFYHVQFIEERLAMLNNGLGFSDEFELEACRYSEKSSSKLKQQYKEWTSTMKKEGTAFFKSVKERVGAATGTPTNERFDETMFCYRPIPPWSLPWKRWVN